MKLLRKVGVHINDNSPKSCHWLACNVRALQTNFAVCCFEPATHFKPNNIARWCGRHFSLPVCNLVVLTQVRSNSRIREERWSTILTCSNSTFVRPMSIIDMCILLSAKYSRSTMVQRAPRILMLFSHMLEKLVFPGETSSVCVTRFDRTLMDLVSLMNWRNMAS